MEQDRFEKKVLRSLRISPELFGTHPFWPIPKPKSGNGKNEQSDTHDGSVGQFDLTITGFEIEIEDGAIVYFFNKIGTAGFYVQEFARSTI